jgi:hypothetical protein
MRCGLSSTLVSIKERQRDAQTDDKGRGVGLAEIANAGPETKVGDATGLCKVHKGLALLHLDSPAGKFGRLCNVFGERAEFWGLGNVLEVPRDVAERWPRSTPGRSKVGASNRESACGPFTRNANGLQFDTRPAFFDW